MNLYQSRLEQAKLIGELYREFMSWLRKRWGRK